MDAKYFYVKDNEPIGPLTLPELLEKDISSKTYVWRKGMENWVMAENMPELFKALQLETENPPRFHNEDAIEYKEEKPPRFPNVDTTHFQKEDTIQQKEEKPPLSKEEKRNQILNSVLLGIVLIAGLCLTVFAFFEYDSGYGDLIGWSINFGYVLIWFFSFVLTKNLRLEKLYKKISEVLITIFMACGTIMFITLMFSEDFLGHSYYFENFLFPIFMCFVFFVIGEFWGIWGNRSLFYYYPNLEIVMFLIYVLFLLAVFVLFILDPPK